MRNCRDMPDLCRLFRPLRQDPSQSPPTKTVHIFHCARSVAGYVCGVKPFLFEGLARALLIEAGSGLFAEGERFLSSRKICAAYRVSRPTVDRALAVLLDAKILRVRDRSRHELLAGAQQQARLLLSCFHAPPLPRQQGKMGKLRAGAHQRIGLRIAVILDEPLDVVAMQAKAAEEPSLADPETFGIMLHRISFLRSLRRRFLEPVFYMDDGAETTRDAMLADMKRKQVGGGTVFRYSRNFSRKSLLQRMRRAGIPTITVMDDCEGIADASVDFNYLAAGHEAMRLLVEEYGHRRIALVRMRHQIPRFDMRVDGALRYLAESPFANQIQLHPYFLTKDLRFPAALMRALGRDRANRPTAIFHSALVSAQSLRRLTSLRIPREISVLCCCTARLLPKEFRFLDTMNQDFGRLGEEAADCLFRLIDGESVLPITLVDIEHLPGKSLAPPCKVRRLSA